MSALHSGLNVRVTFLNGGFCRQVLRFVDGRTWRLAPFYAVFLAIEHPTRGLFLVDTGYSSHFHEHSRPWPRRLYRWVTPVHATENTRTTLQHAGFSLADLQGIIVTHFHADHVGGLIDFPAVPLIYSGDALGPLQARSAWSQTANAFLPGLVPAEIELRSNVLPRNSFQANAGLNNLPTLDLFGDGSMLLVTLPGHAPGHLGVFAHTASGPILYAADAFWHSNQIDAGVEPAWPARIFIYDQAAYRETVNTLRALAVRKTLTVLACHCPRTQTRVKANPRSKTLSP